MTKVKEFLKKSLPLPILKWLQKQYRHGYFWPLVGWARFGSLDRLSPVDPYFGASRGVPIDRYYIEKFLKENSSDIRGTVLEVAESTYTEKFGTDVSNIEILHVAEGNPGTTIVGDLATGKGLTENSLDCMILTQVLPFIYDLDSSIKNCHRSLKAGGVALVSVPGISQIVRYDMQQWGDYWRFTSLAVKILFAKYFGDSNLTITSYGNVKVAAAYLYGLCSADLSKRDLDYWDPDYELIISVRAQKAR